MACPKREELTARSSRALEHIKELIEAQIELIKGSQDQSKLLMLDKELERAVGEKERAFGALSEHTQEHGC